MTAATVPAAVVTTSARPTRGRRRSPNDAAQGRFIFGALSPLVVYLAVFSLLPIVWAVTLSFFDYSARRDGSSIGGLGGDNPYIGLANYRQMFDFSDTAPKEVGDFRNGLKVTALFTVLVVPLNLLITLPLAALIESVHRRTRPVFRTVFFLPVLTSAVAVAIMWQFILDPQRGLLSGALSKITGEPVVEGWISDPNLDFLGLPVPLLFVVVAYLWQDIGYNLVIFIAALQAIPPSLKNAAVVDGGSSLQIFRKVTLPLLKPTIMLCAVLTTIGAFQVFELFQVMTLGGPANQTRSMSLDIYESAFRFQRMGWSAAVSVVLFVVVLVISAVQSRMLRSTWEY
jgi:ABC-type sugar transport system permease subunit